MNFRFQSGKASEVLRYSSWGLATNPFPVAGQATDIFVERSDAAVLDRALENFLSDENAIAGLWYLEGDAGTGKTNYLLSRKTRIDAANKPSWAVGYVPGTQLTPRGLLGMIVSTIGEDRIRAGLTRGLVVDEAANFTDLARVLDATGAPAEKAAFIARWLSGHQTYAAERAAYNIWDGERLSPAVALPYIRFLVAALGRAGLLTHLILFIDELENVGGPKDLQNEYFLAIKNLVNVFNFRQVFVVLAGLREARVRLEGSYSSLSSRLTTARLRRLQGFPEALALAKVYCDKATVDDTPLRLLFTKMPVLEGVRQRDFLAALRAWAEEPVG